MTEKKLHQYDQIEAGYYKTKLVRGGPFVPVKIWFGQPPDPDNPGQLLDRSHRWMAIIDGKEAVDPYDIWAWVAGRNIKEAEYYTMVRRKAWDQQHDPGSPTQNPEQPVDWMKLKPIF